MSPDVLDLFSNAEYKLRGDVYLLINIAIGDIPSLKLFESDTVLAFLDIQPLSKGHAVGLILSCLSFFGKTVFTLMYSCCFTAKAPCSTIGIAMTIPS